MSLGHGYVQLIVFGTGEGARRLTQMLAPHGIGIACYLDNDSTKWGTEFIGQKVQNPAKVGTILPPSEGKLVILVASIYYAEIAEQLMGMGMSEDEDFYDGLAFADFLVSRQEVNENVWQEFCVWKNSVAKQAIPCHFRSLFVKNTGEIYPCCRVWMREDLKIGRLGDSDLKKKIRDFDGACSCTQFRLVKAQPLDSMDYELFNLELSLSCQGNCAMCMVKAPDWDGDFQWYGELERLVDSYRPRQLHLQGGEILIQKKSMAWLDRLKQKHPSLQLVAITNGNVPAKLFPEAEKLFGGFVISLPGFQASTYRAVTGMELGQVCEFAEVIAAHGRAELTLKFLMTPINIHELAAFLKWAAELSPKRILISDANTIGYCRLDTQDRFWKKIFQRSGAEIRETLVERQKNLSEVGVEVYMDRKCRIITGVDDQFISDSGLGGVVLKDD